MLDEIKDKLNAFSLPSRPQSFGEAYSFPEDVSKVSSTDLGTWMFKLAAWKGYALKMYALSEIDRAWLKGEHDSKIARRIAKGSLEGLKVTKDQALGELILGDEEFNGVRNKLIDKDAGLDALKQVVEIYTMQIDVVSREISRRSLDLKTMQLGIADRE